MRLYTIEADGKEKVAVEKNGELILLDALNINVTDMNELIFHYDELQEKMTDGWSNYKGSSLKLEDVKVLAPIPIPLQDVICLGVNYKEHIDETANIVDFTEKKDAVYFSKRVNRANHHNGKIPFYDFVDSLDYDVELGVILKRDTFRIDKEDVRNYIFGYTIINDVSARNIQLKHQQWYFGKSLDGYTPMGPCIVTEDDIKDVHNLVLECYVNGEKRQSSNTAYMITTIEEAISELSQGMTLKAGTIIATGTPGGVGMGMTPPKFLQHGDVVSCRISYIGELVNTIE